MHRSASYVFGTLVQLTLVAGPREAEAASRAVLGEFDRLHWKLHAWKDGALVELNRAIARGATPIRIDAELASLIRAAAELSARSGGLFNPALGQMVRAWNFHADEVSGTPPSAALLEPLVAAAPKMSDLRVEGDVLTCLNRTVQLDFGGYAKGYALDRARALLQERGVDSALLDVGGHVMALGRRAGRPWAVGLRSPRGDGLLARLELHDGEVVSTSGDYERFLSFGGRRYSHVIDPRTGQPAGDALAASVLAAAAPDAGAASDAASSALFVAGAMAWRDAAERLAMPQALLVDRSGRVHASEALRQRLALREAAGLCPGL